MAKKDDLHIVLYNHRRTHCCVCVRSFVCACVRVCGVCMCACMHARARVRESFHPMLFRQVKTSCDTTGEFHVAEEMSLFLAARLQRISADAGIILLKGVETGRYLGINEHGRLVATVSTHITPNAHAVNLCA